MMSLSTLTLLAGLAWAEDPEPVETATEAPMDVVQEDFLDTVAWECRRVIGGTGGYFVTSGTWEYLGRGPVAPSGSPWLGLTCEVGPPRVALLISAETAPFYMIRTWDDDVVRQIVSGTLGATATFGKWRVGPTVSIGPKYWGLGARGLFLPWTSKKGAHRGFEARLNVWMSGRPALQAVLGYTLTSNTFRAKTDKRR